MKKLVPDPPRITTPYFSIQSHLLPADALAHASELLRGISETLDEHCRLHAGEPSLNRLANAAHSTDMARALVEHALARLDAAQGVGA